MMQKHEERKRERTEQGGKLGRGRRESMSKNNAKSKRGTGEERAKEKWE